MSYIASQHILSPKILAVAGVVISVIEINMIWVHGSCRANRDCEGGLFLGKVPMLPDRTHNVAILSLDVPKSDSMALGLG
jgi:hypothetical protein